jgi:hypothetical protein
MLRKIIETIGTRYLVAFLNLILLVLNARALGIHGVGLIGLVLAAVNIVMMCNSVLSGNTIVYFMNRYPSFQVFVPAYLWTISMGALASCMMWICGLIPEGYGMHVYLLSLLLSLTAANARFLLGTDCIRKFNLTYTLQGGLLFVAVLILYYVFDVKPMIAKYLGALPSINRKETFKDNKMYIRKGEYKNEFAKKQETPMATIMFLYSGTCKYDLRSNTLLSFLDQALDMVYTAEIREKEGGTYGVSCNGNLSKYPKEELVLQIVFQTDPAKKDKLSAIVVEQLEKMAKEGPSAEHMQKIKEYMLKKYKDAQKENGYWLNNLDEYFYTGIDNTKDYEKLVNSITAKEVQDFLAKLLKQNNEIQVVMTMPEENK